MEQKQIRNKWLTVRLTEDEYKLLEKHRDETTSKKLSDYVRRLVLNKRVNVKYRNVSVDDFLKDMLQLKKELNGIGNNFNQVVHKLHTLHHIPEFREWALKNELDKSILFSKMEAILTRVSQLYRSWSQ